MSTIVSPDSTSDRRTKTVRIASARSFERVLAIVLAVSLPIREISPVASSVVSVGTLLAILVLIPLVSNLRRYRFGVAIAVTYMAIALSAPLLWAASGGRDVDATSAQLVMLTLAVSFVHIVALLWARTQIGVLGLLTCYSIGTLVQVALNWSSTGENAWKFGLAVPVSVLALTLAARLPAAFTVLVLVGIGLLSVHFEYRSFATFAAVTLVAWLWFARKNVSGRIWPQIAILLAIAYLAYLAFTELALRGLLGERNRIVTEVQIAQSGSVLSGGRVESAATFALFWNNPIGLGPGVAASAADVEIGVGALAREGVNIDGTYVQDYLFGESIKLHSVAADLWLNYGPAGLALAIVFAVAIAAGLAAHMRVGKVRAVFILLALVGLWDLAFSPIGTNLWEVLLAVCALLPSSGVVRRTERSRAVTAPI